MNAASYYVYGIGLSSNQVSYVDWTDAFPQDHRERILCSLDDRADQGARQFIASAKESASADVFLIEAVASPDEAVEAVEFWQCYFRSLGFRLVDCGRHPAA